MQSKYFAENEAVVEIGVDEVGRGCLAGPVFAAAVIFPTEAHELAMRTGIRITDSKQMTARQRGLARDFIMQHAGAWAVASVDVATIDRINIRNATFQAMHQALDQIASQRKSFDYITVDGDAFKPFINVYTDTYVPHVCVINGDTRYAAIAAASILAKTVRDEHMQTVLDPEYPYYKWAANKGYGTAVHMAAIREHGITRHHRQSFRPCRLEP